MNEHVFRLIAFLALATGCYPLEAQKKDLAQLKVQIETQLAKADGYFAIAFRDASGREILINEREKFHAASTMKTPVMIEVFKQAAVHRFSLTDSILIKNEFKSIVDGSAFQLRVEDDSESELYKVIGQKRPLYAVMYQMIIASSNLATNIIIELVDARKVTKTMRDLGAKDLEVLRGVEDSKAFAQGLNNTVTAYDLMLLFDLMAKGALLDTSASKKMTNMLKDQKFNEIIPALLPAGTVVAHKTGSIRGVQHDTGIVFLPNGKRYTLILLSKNLSDEKAAIKSMATVSKMIYEHVTN